MLVLHLVLSAGEPSFFLLLVVFGAVPPLALCAFIAYLLDLPGRRPLGRYLAVPAVTTVAMAASWYFAYEQDAGFVLVAGALWLFLGTAGSMLVFASRRAAPVPVQSPSPPTQGT